MEETNCGEVIRIAIGKERDLFLERLFLDNYAGMESYARRFFRNPDIAQDVVQETFLVAQMKLDDVMQSPSPVGWLYNTLKNIIGDTYRKRRRLLDMCVSLNDTDAPVRDTVSVRTSYHGIIGKEELELLIWIYCEGLTYDDAAHRLGISLSACKKRVQRAKERMKQAISDEW
ncbi:MAG: sigma-70 family RNA polymerase sigma factor [Oscillospiraceae bacterium]|nr:sigma-70 family RNA polymerase sigma factor [Oscillospiraceae bacterium]